MFKGLGFDFDQFLKPASYQIEPRIGSGINIYGKVLHMQKPFKNIYAVNDFDRSRVCLFLAKGIKFKFINDVETQLAYAIVF